MLINSLSYYPITLINPSYDFYHELKIEMQVLTSYILEIRCEIVIVQCSKLMNWQNCWEKKKNYLQCDLLKMNSFFLK
jgi:hypothetical protein